MNPEQFQPNYPGKLVSVSGIPGITHSFIPDPLPPNWNWPESLWPLLLKAWREISSLDGIGAHIPDPYLLIVPLQRREAQLSLNLEGTITEPRQQMLFEIAPRESQSEDDPANSFREIANYHKALQSYGEMIKDLPVSLRLIRNLHSVLMEGVRGSDQDPGEFRRLQNRIGTPPRYVPPPPNELPEALDKFEHYIHEDHGYDQLVNAFLVHYQFEAIHPFRDGNGRVGRLLLSILIQEWCDLNYPWLYMSAYFNANRSEYIDRLLRVSTHGEWSEWIRFCLDGVIYQAQDTKTRVTSLIKLGEEFKRRIQTIGGSVRLSSIVDGLFRLPVVQISELSRRLDIRYQTARSDVLRLRDVEILSEFEGIRPRSFIAPEILALTFGA